MKLNSINFIDVSPFFSFWWWHCGRQLLLITLGTPLGTDYAFRFTVFLWSVSPFMPRTFYTLTETWVSLSLFLQIIHNSFLLYTFLLYVSGILMFAFGVLSHVALCLWNSCTMQHLSGISVFKVFFFQPCRYLLKSGFGNGSQKLNCSDILWVCFIFQKLLYQLIVKVPVSLYLSGCSFYFQKKQKKTKQNNKTVIQMGRKLEPVPICVWLCIG